MGTKAIWPFRVIWVLAVPFGAIAQLDFAWLLADTLNGLMAIPTGLVAAAEPGRGEADQGISRAADVR